MQTSPDGLWVMDQADNRMSPADGSILDSIPAPGIRSHGMAWEDGLLWCVDTNGKAVYKLDPADGRIIEKIECPQPDPHGMAICNGEMWLCDAKTWQVFVLER